MKTLTDLNAALFKQLDRLNNDNLKGEELQQEVERAKAVAMVASQVITNANTVIKVQMIKQSSVVPQFLEYKE